MTKILIITPIYKIVGRKELKRDTECVHDLIKYWQKNNDVRVVVPYARGIKKLINFFNPMQLKYYLNGYNYNCDDISVTLVERQNIIPKQLQGLKIDGFRFSKIINKELQKRNFYQDIIIVHIPSSSKFFLKNIKGKKIAVLHYSDVNYLKKKGTKFIEYLNTNFSKVYCRSKAIFEIFNKYNLDNLSDEIIYSGVPKTEINKEKLNKKFKMNKIKVLYVGKLIKRKKLDILINALAKIDKNTWNLDVIGEGKMLKKYQTLTKKSGLENNVRFLGQLPKEEVFKHMEQADIFCMPSIKETLGLVYLEAMSKGCITIGTIGEGVDGIIQNNKNGYLTFPNEEDLYKLINNIMSLPIATIKSISSNAIKTAKKFNEKEMSKNYLNIVLKNKH